MLDPVFAMDETSSFAGGSRLDEFVARHLTIVTPRVHAGGQRYSACLLDLLPLLGRCLIAIVGDGRRGRDRAPRLATPGPVFP